VTEVASIGEALAAIPGRGGRSRPRPKTDAPVDERAGRSRSANGGSPLSSVPANGLDLMDGWDPVDPD